MLPGSLLGCLAIHFKCFFERGLEIPQQLFSGFSLRVDTGHFLDPADPEVTILLNGRCVLIHERNHTTEYSDDQLAEQDWKCGLKASRDK